MGVNGSAVEKNSLFNLLMQLFPNGVLEFYPSFSFLAADIYE